MKHLLFIVIVVLLFLTIPIFSQPKNSNLVYKYKPSQEEILKMKEQGIVFPESDSTRLKSYESYLLQVDAQIKDTETKILELQKYLLQLQGAKSAFEAVISDEKKYLEQKK